MADDTTEAGGWALWTREDLAMLPESALREMAGAAGVSLPEALTTHELIDAILDRQAEQQEDRP